MMGSRSGTDLEILRQVPVVQQLQVRQLQAKQQWARQLQTRQLQARQLQARQARLHSELVGEAAACAG